MQLTSFTPTTPLSSSPKLESASVQFNELLSELENRELPASVIPKINTLIDELNQYEGNGNDLTKLVKKNQGKIINLVVKEAKITPKNYYRTLWMSLGISVFGIPIGVFIGSLKNNMGLLGVGLPIGIGIGVLVGTYLDNKAAKEGKQLNFSLK